MREIVYEYGPTSVGASVPSILGCIAVAPTLEEVTLLIAEAIRLHLEHDETFASIRDAGGALYAAFLAEGYHEACDARLLDTEKTAYTLQKILEIPPHDSLSSQGYPVSICVFCYDMRRVRGVDVGPFSFEIALTISVKHATFETVRLRTRKPIDGAEQIPRYIAWLTHRLVYAKMSYTDFLEWSSHYDTISMAAARADRADLMALPSTIKAPLLTLATEAWAHKKLLKSRHDPSIVMSPAVFRDRVERVVIDDYPDVWRLIDPQEFLAERQQMADMCQEETERVITVLAHQGILDTAMALHDGEV